MAQMCLCRVKPRDCVVPSHLPLRQRRRHHWSLISPDFPWADALPWPWQRIAAVESHNLIVNKLHLTGVSLRRSDYGYIQLNAWKDHLQHDDMRAFAWSAITASYSAAFLRSRLENNLPTWIQGVTDNHSAAGLLALMEQAHDGDGDYSVRCMAERLDDVTGCLLVGENDLMAPVEHVQSLAEILHWPIRIVPESDGKSTCLAE